MNDLEAQRLAMEEHRIELDNKIRENDMELKEREISNERMIRKTKLNLEIGMVDVCREGSLCENSGSFETFRMKKWCVFVRNRGRVLNANWVGNILVKLFQCC